ncbi:GDP-L-fucose synthase [Gammaproteobacteria bacterium]|jgi:GDP-L-fucose synthase|nr:GDP-L-fucose synthase [Gammaproteobacteria bacterium]
MKDLLKVFVAGHKGMVGSSILKQLTNVKNIELIVAEKKDLDLTNQSMTSDFFAHHNFDHVYLSAAKVGGIKANNTYPADFIYENLMIQSNIINSCYKTNVKKLLFLGSSCIYPKLSDQPIKESYLLSGKLEPTNEPYAIAKIAGIKMCESYNRQFNTDFRSIMPTNLYGEGDNFHGENSHVVPALIKKFHQGMIKKSESVVVWGSGKAKREFLYVDDLARAAIHTLNLDKSAYKSIVGDQLSHLNVGSGEEITISSLAFKIAKIVNYEGDIIFDSTKPEGPLRKVIDSGLINSTDWSPKVSLSEGIKKTYCYYKKLST